MLKLIGYWQEEFVGPFDLPYDWPHPKHFVDENWEKENREKILHYLKGGLCIMECLGYSWCRLEPDFNEREMGCCDLTDGEWVWPEGLAHYVEKHFVRLPDEFINTMKRNHFQIPNNLNQKELEEMDTDYSFWLEWAKRNSKSAI